MGDVPAWSLGRCLSELSTPGMASRWQWAITSPTSGGLRLMINWKLWWNGGFDFFLPIKLLLSETYSYYHPSNMGMYSFSSNGKPLSYKNFQSMIGFFWGAIYVQSLATCFFCCFCLTTWRVFSAFQDPHFLSKDLSHTCHVSKILSIVLKAQHCKRQQTKYCHLK